MTRLIFLGLPGSGKGTQAKTLADYWNIPHISTGDILRQAMKDQTTFGIKAQSYVDSGKLVPDELVQAMVEERLGKPDTKEGWILDGFPRKVTQAHYLEGLLDSLDHHGEKVVNLQVPDEVVVARLLQRGRKDDSEEIIRRRLVIYHQETEPLIDYYRQRQQLVLVNGDQPQESVTEDLKKVIHS